MIKRKDLKSRYFALLYPGRGILNIYEIHNTATQYFNECLTKCNVVCCKIETLQNEIIYNDFRYQSNV